MSQGKITDKQREILEYIKEMILKKGYTLKVHFLRALSSGILGKKRLYPS